MTRAARSFPDTQISRTTVDRSDATLHGDQDEATSALLDKRHTAAFRRTLMSGTRASCLPWLPNSWLGVGGMRGSQQTDTGGAVMAEF